MSDLQAAITKALKQHGGWTTPLQLRDMLPNGFSRGEAFDLALNQLIAGKRVDTRSDDGMRRLVRLAEPTNVVHASGDAEPLKHLEGRRFHIAAPVVADAFHPAPPTVRVPAVAGLDEVRAPRPITPSRKEPTVANIKPNRLSDALQLLARAPLTTSELAKALKVNDGIAGYYLKQLAAQKKVHKPDGRLGPWHLVNGKSAARAAAPAQLAGGKRALDTSARPVNGHRRTGIDDLDLKLKTLEAHAEAAKQGGRTISAFILDEIRADLERLAA